MIETIFFSVATAAMAFYSRNSLRLPPAHGFYRFIAWEFMLLLVVLNIGDWNDAAFDLNQLISSIFMSASLFLVLMGYLSLRRFGQQNGQRNDKALLGFERTTTLVTHGIYRHIRHPMYSSLVFLDGGLFFKHASEITGSIAFLACIFLLCAVLAEEKENIRYFGEPYLEYMKRSKRFLPFLL